MIGKLRLLTSAEERCFRLRLEEGRTEDYIARTMGITVKEVRRLLRSALEKLAD